jgi:hypothetical protein
MIYQVQMKQLSSFDINDMLHEALARDGAQIRSIFADEFDIDPDTYEDGIEIWFGLGSVLIDELGVLIDVRVHPLGTTLTLSR